jgi:hypothetical protein
MAPTSVVFLADEPWQLRGAELSAVLERAGIMPVGAVKEVKSVRSDVTAAFVIPLAEANIWVVAGTGKFDRDWSFHDDSQPLARSVNRCGHWLAWGTAGWTRSIRKELDEPVRRLASEFVGGGAEAFYVIDPEMWNEFRVYPAHAEQLALWRTSGDLRPMREAGLEVVRSYQNPNVVEDRSFENGLRETMRYFSSAPGTDLELLGNLQADHGICTLRMKVTQVKQKYGRQQFVGVLVADSDLIPQLREGLPLLLDTGEVHAWRLNSDPPVFRAQP